MTIFTGHISPTHPSDVPFKISKIHALRVFVKPLRWRHARFVPSPALAAFAALETGLLDLSSMRGRVDDASGRRPQDALVSPLRAFGLAAMTTDEIFAELIDVLIVECSIDLRIAGTRRYWKIESICDEFGFVLSRLVSNGRQVVEIARSQNRPVGIGYEELRARLLTVIEQDVSE